MLSGLLPPPADGGFGWELLDPLSTHGFPYSCGFWGDSTGLTKGSASNAHTSLQRPDLSVPSVPLAKGAMLVSNPVLPSRSLCCTQVPSPRPVVLNLIPGARLPANQEAAPRPAEQPRLLADVMC